MDTMLTTIHIQWPSMNAMNPGTTDRNRDNSTSVFVSVIGGCIQVIV